MVELEDEEAVDDEDEMGPVRPLPLPDDVDDEGDMSCCFGCFCFFGFAVPFNSWQFKGKE